MGAGVGSGAGGLAGPGGGGDTGAGDGGAGIGGSGTGAGVEVTRVNGVWFMHPFFGGWSCAVCVVAHNRWDAYQRSRRGPNTAPAKVGMDRPSKYQTAKNGACISGQCRA